MGRDWPVKPVDQIVEIFRAKGVGGATELENRPATQTLTDATDATDADRRDRRLQTLATFVAVNSMW
jgi:hypothetical protein